MLPQIPLGISLRESASFDSFVGLGNQRTLADIKACIAKSGENYLYLWGPDVPEGFVDNTEPAGN